MGWVKRSLWVLAGVLVTLAVAIAAAFIWLDSRSGRAWLEATINKAAGDTVRLATIGGSLPFHPVIESLELIDEGGRWAILQDIHLDLVPLDLLRRRVTVQRLTVATIAIDRLPQARQAGADVASQSPEPERKLPQLPVSIDIRQLAVASLSLPPEVFGEATMWRIDAAAHLIGRDLGLDLQLVETGPSPLRFDLRFALAESRVGAQASLDDPRGLLLQKGMGQALPLQIRLTDDPDVSQEAGDWRGRLTASVGDSGQLEASLRIGSTAQSSRFESSGRFDGAELLPSAFAPLLGNAVGFHIVAQETAGERIALETLEIQAAAFDAEATGSYRADANRIEASLRLAIPELARFSDLAGQPLAGTAVLTAAARGPLDLFEAEADLNATKLAAGPITADDVHTRLEAAIAPGRRYDAQGRGRLSDIRSGDAALPARLGEVIEFQFSANSDAAAERLALTKFGASSAGLNLSAEASFDRITRDVNAALRLRLEELRNYAELAVPGLAGRGEITAGVSGKIDGAITLRADGGLEDLATGILAVDALLGGRLRLEALAQRGSDGSLEIESATLATASAQLTARGAMDPAADQLSGEVVASVDDLAVLRSAGLQTKGRLRLDAQISGRPVAPAVDARLEGTGLVWQATQVDHLLARLQGTTGGEPSGNLTADLQSGGLALRLEGQAALSADRKLLSVPKLRLRSGGSVVEARLKTALETFLTTGQLTADIPDLAPFSSLAGMSLDGRLNLNLALSAPRDGQAAEFALAANELGVAATGAEPITVRQLSIRGALSDLLRRPAGQVEVSGSQIMAAAARLDSLRATARSTEPNRFAFDGAAAGGFKGSLSLSTAGIVALDRGTTRLTVSRLSGQLAETPLQLQRPLLVTISGANLQLADLALGIGKGSIEGGIRRSANRLDVDITGRALPVGLGATLAGRPEISGMLDLQLALAGPAAQPRGRLTLETRDLRAGPPQRDQPVVGLSAVAEIAPTEIGMEATAAANGHRLLSASGTIPVTFGPAPGAVAVAENRPLRLRARGDGELSALADFLPLAGDRLAGAFRLAFEAEGPAAQPQLTGELSIDRGRYENRASGLVIDALALQMTADHDRVVLRRLQATDGQNGKLYGAGTILLNGGQVPSADLTVSFAGFRALRRSDATLSASGSATVKGSMDAPSLVAGITVDEAEFFIPDPPPPGARAIPVTVIDSATGRVLAEPGESSATSAGAIELDVAVRVPGRTFIRGRGLDSEWEGDIRLRGDSAAPKLTGGLRVVKGKFAFFGKDLALTRGTVTFTGGSKIEPDLDVLAETTSAGTTFQVGAGGTPDDLKIKLSSTPPLPEDEILSRLIFGREMTRLTPAQGLQLAQAAATLSSGGPGMLDKMRRKLGLDTLNIGSGSDDDALRPGARRDATGGNGGTENTGVSAGKYVADGVYVGAEQRLSGETRSKVEIEVLPNVSVETTAGTRGESVGVMWKKDY